MVLQTGPVQLSVNGAVVASYGEFNTCDVDGSPVRTFANTPDGGGGGGATIPETTNLIKGDGAGNGADSGITQDGSGAVVFPAEVSAPFVAINGAEGPAGSRLTVTDSTSNNVYLYSPNDAAYVVMRFATPAQGWQFAMGGANVGAPMAKAWYLYDETNGKPALRVDAGTCALTSSGDVNVLGNLNVTGAKNFVIIDPQNPNLILTHSVIEGPECAVFYRGEGVTEDGIATITLPDYFEALVEAEASTRSVLLTALFEDDAEEFGMVAAGRVVNGQFSVRSSLPVQKFWWEVKAVRGDIPPLQVLREAPPVIMPVAQPPIVTPTQPPAAAPAAQGAGKKVSK
jgi:hypothetical protein